MSVDKIKPLMKGWIMTHRDGMVFDNTLRPTKKECVEAFTQGGKIDWKIYSHLGYSMVKCVLEEAP